MNNFLSFFFMISTIAFIASCDKDDDPIVGCMDQNATNYDPNATEACTDNCCQFDDTHDHDDDYNVPEAYVFTRDGASTVAYNGQICRVNQAAVLMNEAFTNPANAGMLDAMIQNGTGFNIAACTDQVIGDKIAASGDDEVGAAYFQGWMSDIVTDLEINVFPAWETPATPGFAGFVGNRKVNAHGLEPNQAFTKGLIGAMCLDQITNKYTHPDYQASQDNTPSGTGYTDMEHKWDEGFGYLFGMDQLANVSGLSYSASGDVLLLKYAYKIGDDVVEDLYDEFIHGRAAIVAGDYETRDDAAEEIKDILDDIIITKAVDYLRGGADGITDAMNCMEDDVSAAAIAQNFDPSFSGGCQEAVAYFISAGYSCETDLSMFGFEGTVADMCGCSCNADAVWADIFHDLSEGYGFVLSLMFTDAFDYDDVAAWKAILDNEGGNGFWTITPDALTTMADAIESGM